MTPEAAGHVLAALARAAADADGHPCAGFQADPAGHAGCPHGVAYQITSPREATGKAVA